MPDDKLRAAVPTPPPSNDYTINVSLEIQVPGQEKFFTAAIRFRDGEMTGADMGYDVHPALVMLVRNIMTQARGEATSQGFSRRVGSPQYAVPTGFPYAGAVQKEPTYGPSADY